MTNPATNLLKKEITYRLSYRGTLELDVICREALPFVGSLTEEQVIHLQKLLNHKEGDLMAWVVEKQPAPEEYREVIEWLRANHANALKAKAAQ